MPFEIEIDNEELSCREETGVPTILDGGTLQLQLTS